MTDKPVFQPDWGKGFSAGVRYWLFFMICFFVLGYDWLFSIVLGAIGAIATSVIGAWWNAKEDDNATDKPTQEIEKRDESPSQPPPKRSHFQPYGASRRKRQSQGARRFGWLFRKRV
jgi:hypothetical protein